ncbi:hypothetical protein R3F73_05195 [Bradyrhizobium japonicum]|nr:hypothetical protein [Bradyrhizobium japonicum]WRK50914.1 hypothetical protein R3F73_05195 [Bradyrhizobium japonicum]
MIGQYDSSVAFGQSRILLVWTRIIMNPLFGEHLCDQLAILFRLRVKSDRGNIFELRQPLPFGKPCLGEKFLAGIRIELGIIRNIREAELRRRNIAV